MSTPKESKELNTAEPIQSKAQPQPIKQSPKSILVHTTTHNQSTPNRIENKTLNQTHQSKVGNASQPTTQNSKSVITSYNLLSSPASRPIDQQPHTPTNRHVRKSSHSHSPNNRSNQQYINTQKDHVTPPRHITTSQQPLTTITKHSIEHDNQSPSRRVNPIYTPNMSNQSPSPSIQSRYYKTPPRRIISPTPTSPTSSLIKQLRSETFGATQIEIIRTFLSQLQVTIKSAYLIEIIHCIQMESNKLIALQLLIESNKHASLDGHDIVRLLQEFQMTSRKREVLVLLFRDVNKPPMNLSVTASVPQIINQLPMQSHKLEALHIMSPYIIDKDSDWIEA
ncbi:hypothetical protein AKO1_008244, partial [Acrasis kona]